MSLDEINRRMVERVKEIILLFKKEHPDFDVNNPGDFGEAFKFLVALLHHFPYVVVVQAIDELREEARREVEGARDEFYRRVGGGAR